MQTDIPDNIKAILLKIGIELKRNKWQSSGKDNDINIRSGYISLSKEYHVEGDSPDPSVGYKGNSDVTVYASIEVKMVPSIDVPNEWEPSTSIYCDIDSNYMGDYSSDEQNDDNLEYRDMSTFSISDVNNIEKINLAAREIDYSSGVFIEKCAENS